MRNNRNEISIFFYLAFGYAVYTVLTHIQNKKPFIIISLLIAGALVVIFLIMLTSRKIKNKSLRKAVRRRAVHAALALRKLTAVWLVLIMLMPGINSLFNSIIVKHRTSIISNISVAKQAPDTGGQSLANNIETVAMLEENVWESLTVKERMEICQTVADIERRHLGIPYKLNVTTENLNSGKMGKYVDKTHEIVVNTNNLLNDSSWETLNTVCHEAYHSYQFYIIDTFYRVDENKRKLHIFDKVIRYEYEFNNYKAPETGFDDYYNQNCEKDARAYAEDAVNDYYEKIREYLVNKE